MDSGQDRGGRDGWRIRETVHMQTAAEDKVLVPRQIGGTDCGVFVCMFAEMIATDRAIELVDQIDVEKARECICRTIVENEYHRLTTTAEQQGEEVMDEFVEEIQPESRPLRRSTRPRQNLQTMADDNTPANINHDRVIIKEVPGMGWGLFAKDGFKAGERVISAYNGYRVKLRTATGRSYKSKYVVELETTNKSILCVDAWDPVRELCIAYGAYGNDAINKEGRRDCWNAELAIDDYDDHLVIIRPTRDILPGEQIYIWYGPRYWCSDDHDVELMAMAVMTYGVNIETSNWAKGSHGHWRQLKKFKELRKLLQERNYIAPAHIADPFAAKYPPERLMFPLESATGRVMDLEARLKEVGQKPVRTLRATQQITSRASETVIVSGKESDDHGKGNDEVVQSEKPKRDRLDSRNREKLVIEDKKIQGVLMRHNSRLQFPAETEDESRIGALLRISTNLAERVGTDDINGGIMLDIGDIGRIRNGQLNDVLIDQYLRLMCSSVPQYSAEYIPILYTRHIFQLSDGQHVDDIHHKLRQYNLTNFKLLFCPIVTNNHFTMVIADTDQGTIIHYDSAGRGKLAYAQQLGDFLKEHWNWRESQGGHVIQGPYPMQWECSGSNERETPQQTDGLACGVFALTFATLKFYQLQHQLFDMQCVTRMRIHIANCLLHHICHPLRSTNDQGDQIGRDGNSNIVELRQRRGRTQQLGRGSTTNTSAVIDLTEATEVVKQGTLLTNEASFERQSVTINLTEKTQGSSSTIRMKRGSAEIQPHTDKSQTKQDAEAKRKKFRYWVTDDDNDSLHCLHEAGDTKTKKQRGRVNRWTWFSVGQNPKERIASMADHKQQSRQNKKKGKVKGCTSMEEMSGNGLEGETEPTMDIQREVPRIDDEVIKIVNMTQEDGRVSNIGSRRSTRHQEPSTISRALKEWLDGVETNNCERELRTSEKLKGKPKDVIDQFIQALRNNTKIQVLYMQGLGVTDVQSRVLMETLATTRIIALNLGETALRPDTWVHISKLISKTNLIAIYTDYLRDRHCRKKLVRSCEGNLVKAWELYGNDGITKAAGHHIGRNLLIQVQAAGRQEMKRRSREEEKDVAEIGPTHWETASEIDKAPTLKVIEATEMNSTESEGGVMDIEGDFVSITEGGNGQIDLVEMLPSHSSHQTAVDAGQEQPFDSRNMFDGIESAPVRNELVMLISEDIDLETLRRMTTSAEKRRCETSGTDKPETKNTRRYATEERSKRRRLNGQDMDSSAADEHERMAENSRGVGGSSSSIVPAKPT